ncbi:MAG: hypothetical protein M3O80_03090 [Chloroflexota bacterium]|nr:hypothetical protein [Chloroflexota bacterium]
MPDPRYQFTTHWQLDAPARDVFDVLSRVEDYPKWWPQFIKVTSAGPNIHDMTLQSFMRYRISYTLLNQKTDERSLILLARVDGDIRGTVQWDIDPREGGGCLAHFTEKVSARMPLLNALSFALRGVFRLNHDRLMTDGERRLQKYLATRPKKEPGLGSTPP